MVSRRNVLCLMLFFQDCEELTLCVLFQSCLCIFSIQDFSITLLLIPMVNE